MKFDQIYDGEWVKPIMRGYLMKCCDCGLVHKMQFKVMKGKRNKILFRAWRHPRKKAKKR